MNNRHIAGLGHVDQPGPRYEPQFISDLRKNPIAKIKIQHPEIILNIKQD